MNFGSVVRKFWIIQTILIAVCMTSCHTSHRAVKGDGASGNIGSIVTGRPDAKRQRIVDEALTWVGTPYRYAGDSKGVGTDCSGMVMRVYEKVACCKLPRNSARQAEFCRSIDAGDVKVGDLIFFATGRDARKISHVGIIVDNDHFVHASASKGVVVSDIYSPYYQRTFRMFGRVPENNDFADNINNEDKQ